MKNITFIFSGMFFFVSCSLGSLDHETLKKGIYPNYRPDSNVTVDPDLPNIGTPVDTAKALEVPKIFRDQMATTRVYDVYIDRNSSQAFYLHSKTVGGNGIYHDFSSAYRAELLNALQPRINPIVRATGQGKVIEMDVVDDKTITVMMSGISTRFYVKHTNETFMWFQEITANNKEGSLAFIGGAYQTSAVSLDELYENFPKVAELPQSVISAITATRIRMTLTAWSGGIHSFIFFDTAP
ncbi:MAG: hypothetical protein ACRCY4_09705 [Brevinema sp.]